MKWLLDTNVVSETIRRRPSAAVMHWISRLTPSDAAISIVAMAELAESVSLAPDANHRRLLTQWLDTTIANWLGRRTLVLTREILVDWLKLSRQLARKRITRKAPDLMIASTARVHDLILVTRNVRDFADTGVVVYDPWSDETRHMDQP